MKDIFKKRKKILYNTVEYYKGHCRCIAPSNRRPAYSGETLGLTTVGCAIGRLLPKVIANKIDQELGCGAGIVTIWKYLPDKLRDLGADFLIELACLHDNDKWWFKKDLSEEGKEFYQELIETFCTKKYVNYKKQRIVLELEENILDGNLKLY